MSDTTQEPNNPDYLLDHPNAVEDPKKAEIMAHATSGQYEQEVIASRQEALGYLANAGGNGYHDSTAMFEMAKSKVGQATANRQRADRVASDVEELYDKVSKL